MSEMYLREEEKMSGDGIPLDGVGDMIFAGIWNRIASRGTNAERSAALAVMAYFFESCDIFKDPGAA
jgi:hypothetical protein